MNVGRHEQTVTLPKAKSRVLSKPRSTMTNPAILCSVVLAVRVVPPRCCAATRSTCPSEIERDLNYVRLAKPDCAASERLAMTQRSIDELLRQPGASAVARRESP